MDLANQSYDEMQSTKKEYGYISISLENNRYISINLEGSLQQFNDWMEQREADQVRIKGEDVSYIIVQDYKAQTDYYHPDFLQKKMQYT